MTPFAHKESGRNRARSCPSKATILGNALQASAFAVKLNLTFKLATFIGFLHARLDKMKSSEI